MPALPIWFLFSFLAFGALVFVGPILLGAGILLLAVPSLRRDPAKRRTAYWVLGVCPVLLLVGSPALMIWLEPYINAYEKRSNHYELSASRTLGGIAFPAGSTVQMSSSSVGRWVESGRVPVPTVIGGLPLIGQFTLNNQFDYVFVTGTLASPADLNGVPCGPGPADYYHGEGNLRTGCVLARDYDLNGVVLAGGSNIEIERAPQPPGMAPIPDHLRLGTLGRPEELFGIS